ncbi:DUF3576 domain-containing protein [Alphaproteobacteria bacterium]|nr:DUF3576 domain-containing protein [Alphaproteobacteria bacterium]
MNKIILTLSLVFLLVSCSSNNQVFENPITGEKGNPGLFSKDSKKGVSLSDILSPNNNDGGSINVNAFLWRASLNILSIAPLISTDALGGTIITDWYSNTNIKNKRIKITAFILTSELRSDGIKVKAHVQNLRNNLWSDIVNDTALANRIEENILNEARLIRINSLKKQ